MTVEQIFHIDTKEKKNPQETESGDELHRVSPNEQEGLKRRLVAVDVVSIYF